MFLLFFDLYNLKNINVSLSLFFLHFKFLDNMNVVLIGSGNVSTVLGRLIKSAGHTLTEVVSRNKTNAQSLATELNAEAQTNIAAITKNSDIYIIAVSDNAIETIAEEMQLKNKIVVHTSGAVSKNVLQNISEHFGVLYPLQSLRKESEHIPEIPLLIDGNTQETIQMIETFAETISKKIFHANDEQRLKLHLSAVVVSNFTNHLYTLAAEYCKKEGTDFSLLVPLIEEVAERVREYEPKLMQTGPAIRNDTVTIQKHLELLSNHPQLRNVYEEMTKSIERFYQLK
jgi:predicted short-subunit dehydrogenase-like oxidoreductase (DUF2520 family)